MSSSSKALSPKAADVTASRHSQTNVLRYVDPVEGFRGFAALSGTGHSLAAGGLRVQRGLNESTVVRLAEAMTLKERLLGLAVDGAKAGIDYDPHSPGKPEALCRFLGFLRPHLLTRLSLGPDMGTTWPGIEDAARRAGIPSVKGAVARAQGLDPEDFSARIRLLDTEIDGLTLGERRAGHALAHAALAAIEDAGLSDRPVRIGIQGFGTLGRATATALTEAGLTPTAITDEHTCLHCYDGVETKEGEPGSNPGPPIVPIADAKAPDEFFELPLDVLVLAACEDAISAERASRLDVAAVVVGANLGLTLETEDLLHRRGIRVVPDFVGGCGGSASMDALFGPPSPPTAVEVLDRLGNRIRALVGRILDVSKVRGITPRAAALAMADCDVPPGRPYGRWDATCADRQTPQPVGTP
ncbi:MAG: Glu/Leu/Phe/Val dehydrogenase dimerization domain-containing protein [Acidimicrobiales bacterium]